MSALIETHALTRRDERRQTLLLQPTDFCLNRADRVSITGASGSGTTHRTNFQPGYRCSHQ